MGYNPFTKYQQDIPVFITYFCWEKGGLGIGLGIIFPIWHSIQFWRVLG